MPNTPQPGDPEYEDLKAKVAAKEAPQSYTVDQLVKDAKVNVVETAPASKDKAKPKTGMFVAQDGRNYWLYDLDGEMVVLPKSIDQMTEEDFYRLPPSLYNMSPGRLPQNLTVVFRDPQWAGYWFNKSAMNGMRVSVGRALGYVPAILDDVQTIVAGLDATNGAIEQHDLVLMKIHKAKLFMKYKQWIDQAKLKGGIESYKNAAESEVMSHGGDLSKGRYYHTPQATQEFQGLGPVVNLPTVAT